MDYRYIKLGDCLSLITNGFVVKQSRDTDKAGGYPFTRIETLSNGRFNRDRMGYADIYDLKGLESYVLEDEDIIISHINSRRFLGRSVLYKKIGDEIILHGMNVLRIKTNREVLNPVYANYFFQTEYYKQCIDNIRKDAINQSSFSIGDFQKLVIPLPEREYQEKIAGVLSSLDRKIALNRAINRNLEALAKQLYDYWFVQFDFPDENGRPYKSSGGKMVWNEKLKRNIPQNWECVKIQEIAKTYSGGTPTSSKSEYYENGTVPWINSGELNNAYITNTLNFITELGLKESSAKLYPKNTILVALYGATAGKVSFLTFEACSNQAVCGVMLENPLMVNYTRFYLSNLLDYYILLSSGSARDNISQDTIKNTWFIKPDNEILNAFDQICQKTTQLIVANQIEIDNLTKQRDELLPLLMNGQVTIG